MFGLDCRLYELTLFWGLTQTYSKRQRGPEPQHGKATERLCLARWTMGGVVSGLHKGVVRHPGQAPPGGAVLGSGTGFPATLPAWLGEGIDWSTEGVQALAVCAPQSCSAGSWAEPVWGGGGGQGEGWC